MRAFVEGRSLTSSCDTSSYFLGQRMKSAELERNEGDEDGECGWE
jgi:hypothetical protein